MAARDVICRWLNLVFEWMLNKNNIFYRYIVHTHTAHTDNILICNSWLNLYIFVSSVQQNQRHHTIDNCVDCIYMVWWTYRAIKHESQFYSPKTRIDAGDGRAGFSVCVLCVYFFKHVKQTIKHFTKKNTEAKLHIRNVLYL